MSAARCDEGQLRLVLLVTYGCNLDCKYCCVLKELRGRKNMPESTLRGAVDFLLSSSRRRLQLHFFGAEPLILPIDAYRRVLPYARRRAREEAKELEIIVTTNAALLDKRWIRLFREHDVRLEVSLDGDAASHNANRPQRGGRDSYAMIRQVLPLVFASGIPTWVSMVVSPETAARVDENFRHLEELGFRRIFMMVANCVPWPERSLRELEAGLRRLEPEIAAFERGGGVLLNREDWKWPMRMNTELAVDSDGRIYSACVGYLATDPALKERCTLARVGAAPGGIDLYEPRRLTNVAAMGVVFKESKALDTLRSCVRAGAVMGAFVRRLRAPAREARR